ncbi:hypothetical protein SCLCIDRAFT_1215446 [Scleroderma citrinum Foug A]|uniref:Uncharacterized protein n=1 Tax=Scleroderma citrinum Foug A TaxID=1036808 RepID=A0A0C3AB57_9AGAM|nr:hypothetical protein SCLCIDRAFT_1215446 [Scleroderma citrinum Foug A]
MFTPPKGGPITLFETPKKLPATFLCTITSQFPRLSQGSQCIFLEPVSASTT